MSDEQETFNRLSETVPRKEVEILLAKWQRDYDRVIESILKPYTDHSSNENSIPSLDITKYRLLMDKAIITDLKKILGLPS